MAFNQLLTVLKDRLLHLLNELGFPHAVAIAPFVIFMLLRYFRHEKQRLGVPIQGYFSVFEPTILLKSRFTLGARDIIKTAYSRMGNKPYFLLRYDVDFLILPVKYLEELRLVPMSKLSARAAQVGNLEPKWTGLEFLMHSNLHVNVVKQKMIPELWKWVDYARDEMTYGWQLELPKAEDWTEVNLEYTMRMIVARMTAKVFMGYPVCRDPEWLKISLDFSVDMFKTTFGLKMFPPWLYFIAIYLIPARWRSKRQLRQAQEFVQKLMHEKAVRSGEHEADTLLNWQLDNAQQSELQIPEMAARQCILTLASIHTTAMTVANMIYDLCAHPDWFPAMVEEVDSVYASLGGPGIKWGDRTESDVSSKAWCTGLQKLDSLFVESQRHNPVILLNPQRLAQEPITFEDGTHIPKGTRVAIPMHDHHMDPSIFPDPELFDPMRSYRKRHSSPDQTHLHMAGQTSTKNLAFGYGNQACPGRQFAVAEIKLILARLLHEYEFKFREDKKRPTVMYINENVFTDQKATVMMRKRRTEANN